MEKISVIICTSGPGKLLGECLLSLKKQTSPDLFKVILIDNHSRADLDSLLSAYSGQLDITCAKEDKPGLSHAKNRGVAMVDSSYVVFLDDDAQADSSWIELAGEKIKRFNPLIFGGPIMPGARCEKPDWFKDKYEQREFGREAKILAPDEFLSGSNCFIKIEIIKKVGYFNVDLGMKGNVPALGEDTDWLKRARQQGYEISYYPDLIVYHDVPARKMTVGHYLKRSFLARQAQKAIFKNGEYKKSLADVFSEFFILAALILKYPFRDKQSFPFWQNYFIEKIIPRLSGLYSFIIRLNNKHAR